MNKGGSKTFQKSHERNRKCLNIANLVNTKLAKIIKYQLHGAQITYYLSKKLKKRKKKILAISA